MRPKRTAGTNAHGENEKDDDFDGGEELNDFESAGPDTPAELFGALEEGELDSARPGADEAAGEADEEGDLEEGDIEEWSGARFQTLRATGFQDPDSYFPRYASLTDEEAEATARRIWRTINGVNLRENIAPTRDRARVVLFKDSDHAVRRVRMRKV